MVTVQNRKACPNCHSSVNAHATKCPLCGNDLVGPAPEKPAPPPPYRRPEPAQQQPSYPKRVEAKRDDALQTEAAQVAAASTPPPKPPTPAKPPAEPIVLPMLLLLPGAFFLLFGLTLALFSHNGELILCWQSSYWMLYLGMALPLLYLGWRALSSKEEREVL